MLSCKLTDMLKTQLAKIIHKCMDKAGYKLKEPVSVSYPKIAAHGDYTTNVAMIIAKSQNQPPMEVAKKIVSKLNNDKFIKSGFTKVEVVEPGFINFKLSQEFLSRQVSEILSQKGDYGKSDIGKGQKIQIEFISANPTGPLTIGNGRGGFFGDVLANVLSRCGYKVEKEYLINDAGGQIESLGHSVLKDDQAKYQGAYIDDLHKRLARDSKQAYQVGQEAAQIILDENIRLTVEKKMQIKFDHWFSEQKEIRNKGMIEKTVQWLKKKDLLYEKEGAWWFKSTKYGDDKDRVIIKSDGQPTYRAIDFAYHKNKFKRGFDKVINIWGADHHGDVAYLKGAVSEMGYKNQLDIILMQFVRLTQQGKEVKMSKRAGTYVTMSELIDEVGHDIARFFFLMYSPTTHMDFDLDLAKEKSEKNPVYYVQYAFARISSLLNQTEIAVLNDKTDFIYEHPAEKALIKSLIKWPEILEEAAQYYRVQLLPNYAIDLADKFHQFYDKCRVVSNGQVDWSRVSLVQTVKIVLREVLATIGVSAPEKM